MSKLQELYDYYNDLDNSVHSELFITTGISRTEILKILAVLITVERNSDE